MGWLLTALGGFPVQRGTADREALKAGLACIERGEPLVMFPEGTRQSGPESPRCSTAPPTWPVALGCPSSRSGIGGTEAAMPKGAKFIRPVKMVFVIGAPLAPPVPAEGKRSASRRAVRELSAELGQAIQALFDEAQALAGSPNRH